MRQGKLEPAVEMLRRAADRMPREAGAWIQLGLCHLERAEPEEAKTAFAKATELAPSNPAAALFSSLACSDLGQADEAQRWAARTRELSPHNQALPTLEALLKLRQGDVAGGLRCLGMAGAEPASVWEAPDLAGSAPLASRFVLELEKQRLPHDVPSLERSQVAEEPQATPTAKRGPLLLQYTLIGSSCLLSAMLVMMYTIEPDPQFLYLLAALLGLAALTGLLIFRTGAKDRFPTWRARAAQRQGLKLMERALGAPHGRLRERLLENALSSMREAQQLAPDLFRTDFYLGEALLFAGQSAEEPRRARRYLEEGLACFERSWGQDGGNPYLFYYLARTSLLLGRVEASQGYFEKALEKFEKLPEAHFGIGQCRLLMGDDAGGRRALWRAVSGELLMVRERLSDMERLALTQPEALGHKFPAMPPEPEPEPEPDNEEAPPPATAETGPPEAEAPSLPA